MYTRIFHLCSSFLGIEQDSPDFQIFKVLALSVKEAREGINSVLLKILNEHQNQHEKLNKQREYFGFYY